MEAKNYQQFLKKITENCSKVIVGKDEVIRQVAVCFLCGGHVLLEDLPGTGKTMLLRAFSASIGGSFARVQFTPDLMPSDLTGINFYNPGRGEFEFRPGPLFQGMILADEINRATPRTQSALLEAMEERQVSVDGSTYGLREPFMVMATQNPVESYGTFPLPEAQVDRFFMRLSMGYMEPEQEMSVLRRRDTRLLVDELQCVTDATELAALREGYHDAMVSDDVFAYIMELVQRTRKDAALLSGVSTRGAIALTRAAQVTALMEGRDYVIPEDVKREAIPVLAHRVMSTGGRREDAEKYIQGLLMEVPAPLENA